MTNIASVCVYCGSSSKVREIYKESARELGAQLAREKINLVYGGGQVGIMGIIADAVLAGGGTVTGIIPDFLQRSEVGKTDLTELLVVPSMHIRKQEMAERSDGFVVLPGGFGTLEELFEILTWRQLGLHDKPIVIANIGRYWSPLTNMIDHIVAEGFAAERNLGLMTVVDRVEDILPALRAGSNRESGVASDRI